MVLPNQFLEKKDLFKQIADEFLKFIKGKKIDYT